jgi:hypothetical protein
VAGQAIERHYTSEFLEVWTLIIDSTMHTTSDTLENWKRSSKSTSHLWGGTISAGMSVVLMSGVEALLVTQLEAQAGKSVLALVPRQSVQVRYRFW